MTRRNSAVIVLAIILMVGGFLGVLFVGQLVNPAPAPVAVAVLDIPAGTTLSADMIAIDSVHMDPKVLAGLVLEGELASYVGGVVVEPIHAFQPVHKAAISVSGNPASDHRLALALSDPSLVAMVVPVTVGTAPDAIVEGDFVDLNFGVGSTTAFGGMLSTAPTEMPFAAGFGALDQAGGELAATPAVSPTPTPEPLLMLPVAKTVVRSARILSVIREERAATVQSEPGAETRTVAVQGKIIALVVAIPREAQELLEFAIDNGTVRVALLSAQIADHSDGAAPSLGMTWNDLVALVRMEREAALAAGLPTDVFGPGAYAVEATRSAATQAAQPPSPTATPLPFLTATPTP
ncbi:MAG: hypothetical protein IT318_21805 [Anaerolineales bacterium]|nr:hypothetical protein [Anaerolineales bacterium]